MMKMVDSDWLVANLDVSGYYRVNYDMENWRKLLHNLQTSHKVPTTAETIKNQQQHIFFIYYGFTGELWCLLELLTELVHVCMIVCCLMEMLLCADYFLFLVFSWSLKSLK